MQFPSKTPGISEIEHRSAITQQNSTKFETQAFFNLSLKTKIKKKSFPCSFPAKYPASVKSGISQPLLIGSQPN